MKAHKSCSIFRLNASGVKILVQKRIAQRLVTCLLMVFVAGALYAQSISSTITGTGVDPHGSVISNAKVTASNLSQKVLLQTNTDKQHPFFFAPIETERLYITI